MATHESDKSRILSFLRQNVGVLVVDPDERVAKMIQHALVAEGYACDVVADPQEALQRIRRGAYAIVILELTLPGMTGVNLMARTLRKGADTRFVFISDFVSVDTAVDVVKQGAADFIAKPVDLADLCRRINKLTSEMLKGSTLPPDFEAPDTQHCSDLPGYDVIKRIGVGSMGSVFLARQKTLNRDVAIKVIRPTAFRNIDALHRFMVEARAAGQMNHPNIIQVYDFLEYGGCLFLVMEYFRSREARRIVERWGGLPWERALWVALQMTRALIHASSHGIVHRDLKPANILIGKAWEAKLVDFGLAKETLLPAPLPGPADGEEAGALVGTPAYVSPDQIMALPDVDVRSDIYSLGICLYYMLEGRDPFRGEISAILLAHLHDLLPPLTAPDAPLALRDVLHRMTAKKRGDRYQTAVELLADLRKLERDEP